MFAREIQSTFGGARVGALLGSMSQTFTAAGTTQGTAATITTVFTNISTGTEGQGAILPSGLGVSDQCTIVNTTTADVYVYPPVGGKLNGATANLPICLPPNTAIDFTCIDGTNFMANR